MPGLRRPGRADYLGPCGAVQGLRMVRDRLRQKVRRSKRLWLLQRRLREQERLFLQGLFLQRGLFQARILLLRRRCEGVWIQEGSQVKERGLGKEKIRIGNQKQITGSDGKAGMWFVSKPARQVRGLSWRSRNCTPAAITESRRQIKKWYAVGRRRPRHPRSADRRIRNLATRCVSKFCAGALLATSILTRHRSKRWNSLVTKQSSGTLALSS
jgi:hypothetical protein